MQRLVFPEIESLSQGFAEYATTMLQQALIHKPQVTLVVPGGSTPRHFLPILAQCALPWDRITVTLSDERWVDPSHEQSNERLVRTHLLAHLPESTRLVGLKTQHQNPFDALDDIHDRLNSLPLPLSLTVLGLGEDGHIASLFPGMNADAFPLHHCIVAAPPAAPSLRVSLSLDVLAVSEHIVLVITGETKRQLLDRVIRSPDPQLPIAWLLQRSDARITVFETDRM